MALATSFACGKKSGAEKALSAAKDAAATVSPASAGAQNDYTKPYLTDEKMTRFIESMKEDVNPFEVLFKGGQMTNMRDLEKRAQEYNGYARKYGFADFADYMSVWGRIMVGDMIDQLPGMDEEDHPGDGRIHQDRRGTAEEARPERRK